MQLVAIVSLDPRISAAEVAMVASAINVQVRRDVFPAWGIEAAVASFPSLDVVPPQAFVVMVVPNANGVNGIHKPSGANGLPFALVQSRPGGKWSHAASHEVIEVLVDPSCRRLAAGPDPRPGIGVAKFIVEVCDPCQHPAFGYQVEGHPVLLSDFCFPSFYGLGGNAGGPYSFCDSVPGPLDVADGGLLTWLDATGRFFQLTAVSGPPNIIGPVPPGLVFQVPGARRNIRGMVDRSGALQKRPIAKKGEFSQPDRRYQRSRKAMVAASRARGRTLRRAVRKLIGAAGG